jgi:lipoic acid synthetase
MAPDLITKSGLMVGLGETWPELRQVLHELRQAGVDIVTIGQYLRPTLHHRHLPVSRYYTSEEFEALRQEALSMGFAAAACGPLVRSSYRAHRLTQEVMASRPPSGSAA